MPRRPPHTTDLPQAGLLRRFAAMGYDSFLLLAVLAAATVVYLLVQSTFSSAPMPVPLNDAVVHDIPAPAAGIFYRLWLLLNLAAFFIYFWHRNGQTLGMQTWRLYLQTVDGGKVTWRQCTVRCAGAILSWLCLGAGYWWLLIDKDGLTWHDRLSQTRVVVLPKPQQ